MAGRPSDGVRLQKVLAQAGLGQPAHARGPDRPAAACGSTARWPSSGRRVDPEADVIEVDGAQIGVKAGLVHYLLNKPAGVVTTASDPQGRPTVRRPRARPSPGSSRSGASTPTPRGSCCSPTTATSPTGSPTRRSASRRSTWPRWRASPAGARCGALREGVELDDGLTAPAEGRGARRPPARASPSTRAATARCGACARPSATRSSASCAPASARWPSASLAPGEWRALTQDEVRALERAAVAERPRR